MKHCLTILKRAFCTGLILLVTFAVYAQDTGVYKGGIRQGVVNVKFTSSMADKLQRTKISTKSNRLSTGIATFDRAASDVKAIKMRRMFPDTPQTAQKLRKHGLHLWYVMEIDQNVDAKSAVQELSKYADIDVVQNDYQKVLPPHKATKYLPTKTKSITEQPFNDPLLKDQWHYNNTGQHGIPNAYDANIFNAWKLTSGKSNVIVSVHDTGIDINHEDLKANIWVNPRETAGNGVDDDQNGYADDINGWNFVHNMPTMTPADHGTHVAGTIAAVNNNGKGVSGIAGGSGKGDGVKIMPLQIIGATTEATALSYIYAAQNGAVISQNSWNYTVIDFIEAPIVEAIKYFIEEAGDYEGSPMKGGIVIFSSGNKASEAIWYPGYLDMVFTVNSIGPDGKLTGYSNFGTWTNICAPGGNSKAENNGFGTPAGVLSTFVGNEYGYMDGTSMACPHVSGIAALILANSPTRMTNTMLWKRLEYAGKNIDNLNPDHIGKLGVGAIDAFVAVQNDEKIAPDKINDLSIKTFTASNAILEWIIPEDKDNLKPESYTVYYSKNTITGSNYKNAFSVEIPNTGDAGQKMTPTIDGLVGNTLYYFAVTSTDKWGNISDLSNVVSGKSEEFASIGVNTGNPSNNIILSTNINSNPTVYTSFDILNKSTGTLIWDYYTRNTGSVMATSSLAGSGDPVVNKQNAKYQYSLGGENNYYGNIRATKENAKSRFSPFSSTVKSYVVPVGGTYIGDSDISIPTSSAVKYIVNEDNGFNLTGAQFNLTYSTGSGDIKVEVYKDNLEKKNIIHTQSFTHHANIYRQLVSVTFKEHLNFEKGDVFYIAIHVPKGSLYPLLIQSESSEEYSNYCYYSSSMGNEWIMLEHAILTLKGPDAPKFAWNTGAVSEIADTGKYLTLDPASGTITASGQSTVNLTANGTYLINGTYNTNLILKSNSPGEEEYRIPVTFTVSGHKPEIVYPTIANFGQTFNGKDTIVDIILENHGYGLMKDVTATITGSSDYTLSVSPDTIKARNIATYRVKFKPTAEGNISGTLNVTDGTSTFAISLFGTGRGTPKITLDPTEQTKGGLTLGSTVSAEIKVKNEGAYPMKYFIPGFDNRGISTNWPNKYHSYGYIMRSNRSDISEDSSLAYNFTDISTTGTDITSQFIGENYYSKVPIGFSFPYYDGKQDTIYITKGGFTTFDNSSRPVNVPTLSGASSLKGYISLLGYALSSVKYEKGKILYKNEPDRLIIQYENGLHGQSYFTAQMVLFANGDIRFYYKNVPPASEWGGEYMTILIEDMNKKDGIKLRDQNNDFFITNGTAIGLDYPGKPIITSIENASGSVSPGEFATVKVNIATASLAEGITDRYVNIISDDPDKGRTQSLIKLDIVAGGVEKYTISGNAIDFGTIYKSIDYKQIVKINNTGTKEIAVSQLIFDASKYTITGTGSIKPGQYHDIIIVPNTSDVTTLEDELTIKLAGGQTEKVTLKASVSLSPIVNADISLVEKSMTLSDKESIPFTIENTGYSDLTYSTTGSTTIRFEETSGNPVTKYGYEYKTHNSGEATYSWIDILSPENKIENSNNLGNFWTEVNLPFSFKFYDKEYSSIKINTWGIIAFDGNPVNLISRTANLPQIDKNSAYITPGVGAYVYNNANYEGLTGTYFKEFGDYFVISWEHFTVMSGKGTQSMQLVLYKDGSFKFQYKPRTVFNDTNYLVAGIQELGSGTTTIASPFRQAMKFGKGLAYLFMPSNSYTLPSGASATGNIHIDASKAYGGIVSDTLTIASNDPTNPLLKKPFKITIDGTPTLELSETEIDFGVREVSIESGQYKGYTIPLYVINSGTSPLLVTNAKMEKGDQSLVQEIYWQYSDEVNRWDSISKIFVNNRQMRILPGIGNKLYTQAKFTPKSHGEFEDVLILTTSEGEKRITLKGKVEKVESPVLNVNKTPIDFSFDKLSDKENKTINFDNINGEIDLKYTASVSYRRYASEMHLNSLGEEETIGTGVVEGSEIKTLASGKAAKADETYNRILMYNGDIDANAVIGTGGDERFTAATHYNAGPEGFNVTHVATLFRALTVKEGTIEVEVRAGGRNILDAVTLAKGSLAFTNESGNDEYGSLKTIKLDNEALILPNEDFYVIFRYPLLIGSPQLGVNDPVVETVPFRYMFRQNNTWYDLQTGFANFKNGSYAHIALEKDPKSSGWLKVLTNTEGTVKVGESSSLDIEVKGEFAVQGEQKAAIVFASNDLENPSIEIPVTLYMNQGPQFINAPANITITETESRTITINVEDPEGNAISNITTAEEVDFVTHSINNGVLKITIAPAYGDAGSYVAKFKAIDEHGMSNEMIINIEVLKSNRAPVYSGDITKLVYSVQNEEITYNINDLFSDPDGDDFTFTVEATDPDIVSVYQSAGSFRVKPKVVGNTTLDFTVTDVNGGITTHSLEVNIEDCINASVIVQKWNSVLLVNNANGTYKHDSYQWYKNGQPIDGATKQYYAAGGNGSEELDFNATYFVKMETTDGKVVYSCNYTPQQLKVSLSAYPNPVKRGQQLTVEAQLPDLSDTPVEIQIINMSGQIVKKQVSKQNLTYIDMPATSGSYIVRISQGSLNRTFNIIVE